MAPAVREQRVVRYRVAGFWQRFAAAALDTLVLAPWFALLGVLLGGLFGGRIPRWREIGVDYVVELIVTRSPLVVGGLILCLIIGTLYFTLFQAARGQTVGQHLLGLYVITKSGTRPDLLCALARTGAAALGWLLCGLGLLWIGFDREKRGLHDWLAGTYVVRSS